MIKQAVHKEVYILHT